MMFQYNFYRPANVIFLKNGCGTQKFPISAFQSHLQTKNNLHIFILQSQFISAISISDTIAVNGWSNFLFSNFWHFWFPNFATKKQNCLHCERPGSQLVRESRQKFPSLLEKLFFSFWLTSTSYRVLWRQETSPEDDHYFCAGPSEPGGGH